LRQAALPAVPIALLRPLPVLFQPFQLCRDLGEPGRLGFEAFQLFPGGGEFGEVLLRFVDPVGGPAFLALYCLEFAGEPRVFPIGCVQRGAGLAGGL
jgi:hypothetical protein